VISTTDQCKTSEEIKKHLKFSFPLQERPTRKPDSVHVLMVCTLIFQKYASDPSPQRVPFAPRAPVTFSIQSSRADRPAVDLLPWLKGLRVSPTPSTSTGTEWYITGVMYNDHAEQDKSKSAKSLVHLLPISAMERVSKPAAAAAACSSSVYSHSPDCYKANLTMVLRPKVALHTKSTDNKDKGDKAVKPPRRVTRSSKLKGKVAHAQDASSPMHNTLALVQSWLRSNQIEYGDLYSQQTNDDVDEHLYTAGSPTDARNKEAKEVRGHAPFNASLTTDSASPTSSSSSNNNLNAGVRRKHDAIEEEPQSQPQPNTDQSPATKRAKIAIPPVQPAQPAAVLPPASRPMVMPTQPTAAVPVQRTAVPAQPVKVTLIPTALPQPSSMTDEVLVNSARVVNSERVEHDDPMYQTPAQILKSGNGNGNGSNSSFSDEISYAETELEIARKALQETLKAVEQWKVKITQKEKFIEELRRKAKEEAERKEAERKANDAKRRDIALRSTAVQSEMQKLLQKLNALNSEQEQLKQQLSVLTGEKPVNTGEGPVNTGERPVNTGDRPVNTGDRPAI
jgi:hypothetical protein